MRSFERVNKYQVRMDTIGSRLREERLRLGLSQEEFAAVGGVARRAQTNYEADERSCDAKYLAAVAGVGVDLLYVLVGVRVGPIASQSEPKSQGGSDEGERDLIESYRQLNEAGKAALQAFMASLGLTGQLTTSAPKRAKRLAENRRAALDQRTAENVERAVAEVERARAERAARKKK
nr:helix-turn-helix transcriptional regulator [Burkholderia gladioli]